jgi:superfamily I DNA/RNA helicase
VQKDEGAYLRSFVKFIDEINNEPRLIRALNHTVDEEDANVVISTAHKAKGREWRSVKLLEDFVRPDSLRSSTPPRCACYTSLVTRAREGLDVAAAVLSFINAKDGDGK